MCSQSLLGIVPCPACKTTPDKRLRSQYGNELHANDILAAIQMSATRSTLVAALAASLAFAQFPGQQRPKPTGPWMDKTLSPDRRAELLVQQMTLDEKVSLLHGGGWGLLFGGGSPTRSLGGAGFVPGIERLGIPDLQMADAAMGV